MKKHKYILLERPNKWFWYVSVGECLLQAYLYNSNIKPVGYEEEVVRNLMLAGF